MERGGIWLSKEREVGSSIPVSYEKSDTETVNEVDTWTI